MAYVGYTLTTRIPDELREQIEQISEEEHLDRSTTARRLLEDAVEEHRLEKALERYENGEISLGKAAELAGTSRRHLLAELKERDVHFRFSQESLDEEVEAVRDG